MKQQNKIRVLVAANLFLISLLVALISYEGYSVKFARKITATPTPATETIHYQTEIWLQQRPISQALASPDVQIALIGDSIIEGWLTSAVAPNSINLGISRDSIPDLIERTDPNLVNHVPTWYLGIGANDALTGAELTDISDFVDKLSTLYGHAERLIWRSILPVAGNGWDDEKEEFRLAFNSAAQRACGELPNCVFLEPPLGYAENLMEWTSDGLHPNARGYSKLTEQLCALIPCFLTLDKMGG